MRAASTVLFTSSSSDEVSIAALIITAIVLSTAITGSQHWFPITADDVRAKARKRFMSQSGRRG